MRKCSRQFRHLIHLVTTLIMLIVDTVRYFGICLRLRSCFKISTIRCKAKCSQDTGVPGLRGAKRGCALNAPGA
jgi:hypothetical protein